VPEGEVYVTVESPRGELGCYVVSDGGPRPWRVKFRAPSFVALEAAATCMTDALIADMIAIVGSLRTLMGEVDRCPCRLSVPVLLPRLPPHMADSAMTFADEVRELAARFPDSRSATIPALRLAQERHGWLPPEAFREVADALGLTPAYCHAVASFYD